MKDIQGSLKQSIIDDDETTIIEQTKQGISIDIVLEGGCTLLEIAMISERYRMAQLLLILGSNPNQVFASTQKTALRYALDNDLLTLTYHLIMAGATIDIYAKAYILYQDSYAGLIKTIFEHREAKILRDGSLTNTPSHPISEHETVNHLMRKVYFEAPTDIEVFLHSLIRCYTDPSGDFATLLDFFIQTIGADFAVIALFSQNVQHLVMGQNDAYGATDNEDRIYVASQATLEMISIFMHELVHYLIHQLQKKHATLQQEKNIKLELNTIFQLDLNREGHEKQTFLNRFKKISAYDETTQAEECIAMIAEIQASTESQKYAPLLAQYFPAATNEYRTVIALCASPH